MAGEVGEAFRVSRPPPPFHESVVEPAITGDLTWLGHACIVPEGGSVTYNLTVAGQCRNYTDFADFGRM